MTKKHHYVTYFAKFLILIVMVVCVGCLKQDISSKSQVVIPTPPDSIENRADNSLSDTDETLIDGEIFKSEEQQENSVQDDTKEIIENAMDLCNQSRVFWKVGENDRAIEALDEAYSAILSVEDDNNPKDTTDLDDIRHTIAKRLVAIYSSRMTFKNGTRNKEIPDTLNQHIQAEISSFTIGPEKDLFRAAYRRSGKYRAKIESVLQEAGLPTELSWLPLVESWFKVNALSPARALGLWQFIPSTGYRYNLNREAFIDERLDPEKSTMAAIEYLKDLHGMFGDWTTVLAAYNCGENRVLRVIKSQHIDHLDNFWDLYERLPRETARYVPRFLATLHIVKEPARYGLSKIEVDAPLEYETVYVNRQVSLTQIANATQLDYDLLQELNTELRKQVLPNCEYNLRVPPGKGILVSESIKKIEPYTPQKPAMLKSFAKAHRVRKGESVYTIARKYRVSATAIISANRAQQPTRLKAGSVLWIPIKDGSAH